MGGLAKAKFLGYFDSSRPKTGPFDALEKKGKHMSAKQRTEFLAREKAKETKGNGLQAQTPLTSRYA